MISARSNHVFVYYISATAQAMTSRRECSQARALLTQSWPETFTLIRSNSYLLLASAANLFGWRAGKRLGKCENSLKCGFKKHL